MKIGCLTLHKAEIKRQALTAISEDEDVSASHVVRDCSFSFSRQYKSLTIRDLEGKVCCVRKNKLMILDSRGFLELFYVKREIIHPGVSRSMNFIVW